MISTVPASERLPLDAVQAAAAAYALRKVRAAYAGNCIQVRRSSDNGLANVGFTASGNLDIAALLSHVGAGDGFIATWYDQSGNGVNLTQATAGNQPQIVAAGVVNAEGSRSYIVSDSKLLTGTLAGSVASSSMTVYGVVRNRSASAADDSNQSLLSVLSGASACALIRLKNQAISVVTYATPGGSSTQTTDVFDVSMTWTRFGIAGITIDGTALAMWVNNRTFMAFAMPNVGASGTALEIGSLTSAVGYSELYLYDSPLSQLELDALYAAVNAHHRLGPVDSYPVVAVEERTRWDTILRKWVRSQTAADRTVSVGSLSWDGTYADTDELLRIYYTTTEIDNNPGREAEGLMVDERWFQALDDGSGYGMETTRNTVGPYPASKTWQFARSGGGSNAAVWAKWYAMSLPKAGGTEGNPFYQQRGVAVRALIEAIITGIRYCKQVDLSQAFTAHWDFQGGTFQVPPIVFMWCRDELPEDVQNAYLEMLYYVVKRLYTIGPRFSNANMEMKGVTAICAIYAVAKDSAIRDLCVRVVKKELFGSETGTPETSPLTALFSPAGHIREGYPAQPASPETTYNGHSMYHLISGLSLVRGDANWNFLATVVDLMAQFKFAQYFIEPDSSITGPSGYGGRTGGIRAEDQGFDGNTYACLASFSTYGRPGHTTLADEATLVAGVASPIASMNATLATGIGILTGTGLHTRGHSSQRFIVTAQASPANTFTATGHGLNDGDLVRFLAVSSGVLPGGIAFPSPGAISTLTYFVVNKTADTFQVSTTLGGSAVTLTTAGTNPFACVPAIYLGGAPNLVYTPLSSCSAFIRGTYLAADFIYLIYVADNTNKVVFAEGGITIPEASGINYAIENGPRTWGQVTTGQHWVARWPSFPDAGYYTAQRARIAGDDSTLKTPWQLTATHNVNFANEFWSYKDTDGSREWGFFIEALSEVGGYSGWYGGKIEAFWTRDAGMVICSRHDKSGDETSQTENTRVYQLMDNWATTHLMIKDDTDMRFSSVATNVDPSAVSWNINGTPKTLACDLTFDHGAAMYGETAGIGGSGLTGSVTVQTDPTNTMTQNGHSLQDNDCITVQGTALPSPLATSTKYFVVNRTANTFQVATTRGGTPIVLTTTGTAVVYVQRLSLKGVSVITSAFEVLTDGLKHQVTITQTGTDLAKEMWAVIPVYLRDGDQAVSTEATIEYWNGQSWNAMTPSIINAHYLRIGRDFGAGKKYVWIEFWQPTQPASLNAAVWTQSYQGNARFRMIKVDMLGYTGTAKAIPPSTTIWYKILTTDPGFVPTAPSVSIVYPTANTIWPEGGVIGVTATVDWIAASGTVYLDYRVNALDWTQVGTLTNTTGNVYEFIGDSVPADMVELRVRAVPPTGNTSTVVVVTYSSPYDLLVEDQFTVADSTLIDGSYTGWVTNTTGNAYAVPRGTVQVQSGKAYATALSNGSQRTINCGTGANTNLMVEVVAVAGGSGTDVSALIGTGASGRTADNGNMSIYATVRKAGVGSSFHLREDRDGAGEVLINHTYGSYSPTNPYRIRLCIHTPYVAARFTDINNGNVVAASIGAFTLGVRSDTYAGFQKYLGSEGASIDELKIWKQNTSWTPPTIIPFEDPDPPPEITPDLTVLYPTAGLVFPVGGVWPFRAFVDWGTLTPSTVIASYTTNGTDYTTIGPLQLEAGTTYRYVGGTIPSGVTGIRVVATGMTESPAIVDVAVTSATMTTVLSDSFTGANNTNLGSSWSGWQTNTTGNVYQTLNGSVSINTNRAVGTVNTSNGNVDSLNVNDADMIVECTMQTGTTALTSGVGAAARMNAFNQAILAWMSNTTSTTACFKLSDLGGTQPTVTADYASWTTTKFFRIRVQTVGSCAVAQWFDVAAGDALAGTLALFDLTDWNAVTHAGFILGRSQQGSKNEGWSVATW